MTTTSGHSETDIQWVLEKTSPHATRVTFINRTNAAGSVSKFLSDLGCRKTTYLSLKNLRKITADPRHLEWLKKMALENKGLIEVVSKP